ncbi:spondin domain-containing protein [Halorubrum sp. F4]|uniref:spondin domain-containing protein n=1 Tax=Halorubrum sp. F4 TaxID=2989715 RepID=UPI00247FF281|nr:spondin domain-containing protein [Halorubrum sp. F4]
MSDHETRRRVLQGTGTVALLALAGCTGDEGGSGMDEEDGMNDGEGMDDGDSMDEANGTNEEGGMNEEGDGMDEEGDGMMGETTTIAVRIENVSATDVYPSDASTGGAVWISPGAYAVHEDANPIHEPGEAASIGLEALAEAGPPDGFDGEPGLVDELDGAMAVSHAGTYTPEDTVADPNDPTGEAPGAPPIAPGGAFEFEVETEPGCRLSFASMFVPSNDVYLSPADGIELWPEGGDPAEGDVTDGIALFDAGTEPNAEPGFGPDQAPAQDDPTQGDDEGGVVRRLADVDDGYDYPAVEDVVRVTLAPQ